MAKSKIAPPPVKVINKVTIRGTVRRIAGNASAMSIYMITRNPVTNRVDFPHVLVFNSKEEMMKVCPVGARITVTGYIQTSKKYPGSAIIATEITPEKDRLNAEFENEEYIADVNKVLLQGTVASTPFSSTTSNLVMLSIKVDTDGHESYPRLYAFSKSTCAVAAAKKIGDPIRVLAYMSSRTVNKQGEQRREQTLVVQNIE